MNELEKFYNLEDALQDAILSEKTAFTVYNLGEKNGLNEKTIGIIGGLTRQVLMKELPIKDFTTEVELKANIDADLADEIALAIEKEVFNPVKVLLLGKGEASDRLPKVEKIDVFQKQKHIFKNNYRENNEE